MPKVSITPNDEDQFGHQGAPDGVQEQTKIVIGRAQNNGRIGFVRWDISDDLPAYAVPRSVVINFTISNITVGGPQDITIGRCTRAWTEAQTTWNSIDHGGTVLWPGGIEDAGNREKTWVKEFPAGLEAGDPFPVAVPASFVKDALFAASGDLQLMFIGIGLSGAGDPHNWSLAGAAHATPAYRAILDINYSSGGPEALRASPLALRHP
jgi:hypothetical protein